jgi:hypothetical protein
MAASFSNKKKKKRKMEAAENKCVPEVTTVTGSGMILR